LTFVVRQLDAGDLASYRDIRLEALREHPEAFGASYEAVAARDEDYFAKAIGRFAIFGAFAAQGGRQTGLAAFARHEGAKLMHRGDLIQMYVRPEGRGSGCGLALIEAIVAHAKPLVAQLHLGVATNNEPAIQLYKRAGFHIYGTEPRSLYVDGRYVDEHLMVRFLDKAPGKKNDNA
jgi:ribosomal protein S18 acetylase RimI-like enzyme